MNRLEIPRVLGIRTSALEQKVKRAFDWLALITDQDRDGSSDTHLGVERVLGFGGNPDV